MLEASRGGFWQVRAGSFLGSLTCAPRMERKCVQGMKEKEREQKKS